MYLYFLSVVLVSSFPDFFPLGGHTFFFPKVIADNDGDLRKASILVGKSLVGVLLKVRATTPSMAKLVVLSVPVSQDDGLSIALVRSGQCIDGTRYAVSNDMDVCATYIRTSART